MEVQVMQDILGKNDQIAAENQVLFAEKKIFCAESVGIAGSGEDIPAGKDDGCA